MSVVMFMVMFMAMGHAIMVVGVALEKLKLLILASMLAACTTLAHMDLLGAP
jgi:hypothetical protein